jgi:hypothetical protein
LPFRPGIASLLVAVGAVSAIGTSSESRSFA